MAEDKNLQKKLAKFAEEIMNIARSECSTIEEETQSDLETQRASLKAAADAEAAKYFEAELREIDGQSRAAAFSEKDRLRKELFSIREKYMSNVFAQAAERLSEFTASSDYAAFLNAKAAEAAAQGDFAGGTLYLRQEDLSYADDPSGRPDRSERRWTHPSGPESGRRTGRTEAVVLQQFQTGHHTVKLYGGEIV